MQALNLPTVMNVNPGSIYNKKEEFHKFVDEEAIYCIFMSESWECPNQPLEIIMNLPNFKVISNPPPKEGYWRKTCPNNQLQQIPWEKSDPIFNWNSMGVLRQLGQSYLLRI